MGEGAGLEGVGGVRMVDHCPGQPDEGTGFSVGHVGVHRNPRVRLSPSGCAPRARWEAIRPASLADSIDMARPREAMSSARAKDGTGSSTRTGTRSITASKSSSNPGPFPHTRPR